MFIRLFWGCATTKNKKDKKKFKRIAEAIFVLEDFSLSEKGKVKLQYHIHILLSGNMLYDKEVDIVDTLNSSIRKRAKCISATKPIHCQVVDKPSFAMSYLNKEMSKEHLSLDTQNSILIKKLWATINPEVTLLIHYLCHKIKNSHTRISVLTWSPTRFQKEDVLFICGKNI